ncbi:MAG: hypothetical protein ABIP48_12565 [Planctomycetota bacterium]
MEHAIGLQTEVIHRYVFELRYESGLLYWDRAGRIAREIASREGWQLNGMDTNGCHLSMQDQNLVFNFGPGKLDLSQTQTNDVVSLMRTDDLGAIADSLSGVVAKTLELTLYPRIGFRAWLLYPAGGRTESWELVQNLRLFQTASDLGQPEEVTHSLVVERPHHMLRIAVAPAEQQIGLPESVLAAARRKARAHWKDQRQIMKDKLKAKKVIKAFPQFSLLVDLDAYMEEPPYPDGLSVSDFVHAANVDFREVLPLVLAAKGE